MYRVFSLLGVVERFVCLVVDRGFVCVVVNVGLEVLFLVVGNFVFVDCVEILVCF